MKHIYFFVSILSVFVFLVSCAKKMDEELIPSYVQINSINVLTDNSQGSSSSNISDAWFYVDGADRGAYPLPATIPHLGEGVHTLRIAPGIKLNGTSSTRVPYPLVEPKELDLELIKDSVINLTINCKYYSTTHFEMIEEFEDINVNFEPYGEGDFHTAEWRLTNRETDPSFYVFEGSHSGASIMKHDSANTVLVTKQVYDDIPKGGEPVFVELDFNTNTYVDFKMSGIEGGQDQRKIVQLNPTDGEWKKIYINLTNIVSYDVDYYQYRFWFFASPTNGDTDSYFIMDNFKLLYRDTNE